MLQRPRGTAGAQRPRARTASCLCHKPANRLAKAAAALPPVRRGSDLVLGGPEPNELSHFFRDEAGVSVMAKGCVRSSSCGLTAPCSHGRAGPGARLRGASSDAER